MRATPSRGPHQLGVVGIVMPEGDTVWRAAARLHGALADQPVTLADLRWPRLPPHHLVGSTTVEVVSVGKHLLQRFSNGWTLHSHLRMDGSWRIAPAGPDITRALRRHDLRAAVGTAHCAAIGVRLGQLDLVPTSQERTLVGHLGPDILTAQWDHDETVRRLAAFDGFVVDALLDQRVLAGIGTYWASEALFLERLLPWTRTSDLSADRLMALTGRLRQLLTDAISPGRPPIGDRSGAREAAWVHARSGRSCRRCGDLIRVALTGAAPQQRTIFSCPTCQGGWAPSDDRRPQAPLGSDRRQRS